MLVLAMQFSRNNVKEQEPPGYQKATERVAPSKRKRETLQVFLRDSDNPKVV